MSENKVRMNARNPNWNEELPNIEENSLPIKWHSLHCELVTPMYGGGVKSTIVDQQMPIRATGIRGQLRFWWRLLAKQKWHQNDSPEEIRKKEFALWGGVSAGSDEGKAGLVLLRIRNAPNKDVIARNLIDYRKLGLRYVLFPAANETNSDLIPHKLLEPNNIKWTLDFAFGSNMKNGDERRNEVIETLQWWANFGGIGSRTRRGLGAVYVAQSDDFPQIMELLDKETCRDVGCDLAKKQPTLHAIKALETVINKLSNFRQGVNVGRNQGQQRNRPGRSRWPEPDALRRINNTHAPLHEPEHEAGDIFPRAMFGLPIIYKFTGNGEPDVTNITPTNGERLASPLILRPVYAGTNQRGEKQWQATALLLPYAHIANMNVKVNNEEYPIWQDDVAEHIRPINDNGGGNPLTAFLHYFAR